MTNNSHSTLYVGMSTDLPSRIDSHRKGLVDGFASRYRCATLVYFEGALDVDQAYVRERQIKGWKREKKRDLIDLFNPTWKDMFEVLIKECE